jgi:hypothetical protein
VADRRVTVSGNNIVLGVPEIALRFIRLLVLLLLLHRGEALGFLISPARGLGALATDEECGASDQANELKVFHISNHIMIRFRL